jgi:acetyltransferase-like isoleucine patch superfamily enzyme
MSRLVLQPPQAQPVVPLRRLLHDFGQQVHNHRLVGINRYANQGHDNQIVLNGCTFKHSTLTVQGHHNQIIIAPNTRLSDLDIYLKGDHHRLEIGPDCCLQGRIELIGTANAIRIGQGTSTFNIFLGAFESNCAIAIGDDCMFSGSIDIRTSDNHGIIDTAQQRVNPPRNITIGNHVWIGQRVLVLKGTQIGDNSVIGAGAIVSKDIPPNSVAAGVPAKVVKTGVNWVRDLADLT